MTWKNGSALGDHGDGAVLTERCLRGVLGNMGEYLVSGAMTIFAFATMIAWFFLGKQTLETVLEQITKWLPLRAGIRKNIEWGYLVLYGYAVFLGCVSNLEAVWALSDIWNGMMAFPNIFALLLLQRQIRYPWDKRKT